MIVVYVHSFAFTGTPISKLFVWIDSRVVIYAFFLIGGYFLAKSWENDPNAKRFLQRRILRIYPALIVCVLLTTFLLGPLISDLSLIDYFQANETYAYLKNLTLYVTHFLPGVFTDNIYPRAVNGSLWTLPIEVGLYITLVVLGLMNIFSKWTYLFLALISAIVTFWGIPEAANNLQMIYGTELKQIFICGYYFWIGATFYAFNLKRYFSLWGALLASILFLISPFHHLSFQLAIWILWPYIILSIGLASPLKISSWLSRHGDFSYGIYIYAFPIQQILAMLYPNMHINLYILLCMICIIPCAVLSYKFIEQPFFRFKPSKSIPAVKTMHSDPLPIK